MRLITMSLDGETKMTKYPAQMEPTNNQMRKDWRKNDLLIFLALNMFILKVDVKLLDLGII